MVDEFLYPFRKHVHLTKPTEMNPKIYESPKAEAITMREYMEQQEKQMEETRLKNDISLDEMFKKKKIQEKKLCLE